MSMRVEHEQLEEIIRLVFETTLGLEPGAPTESTVPEGSRVSTISISGAWDGKVSFVVSERLARKITAVMLACSEEDTTPRDVDDAVGEVVNMLGGSVKALVPGPSQLSLPKVAAGSIPPAAVEKLVFDCAGQTFAVTVEGRAPKGNE